MRLNSFLPAYFYIKILPHDLNDLVFCLKHFLTFLPFWFAGNVKSLVGAGKNLPPTKEIGVNDLKKKSDTDINIQVWFLPIQ